jgi:FlaA1/EpsC-like NDP-sugar epimerase
MLKNYRKKLIQFYDLFAVLIVWYLSFLLRYNFDIPASEVSNLLNSILILIFVHLVVAFKIKLHHATWRYFSFENIEKLILLSFVTSIIIASISLMIRLSIPRSVFIIFPLLNVAVLGGGRFAYRYIKEKKAISKKKLDSPTIIYGAGAAAVGLVKVLKRSDSVNIVAFMDDNSLLHERELLDIPVFGGLSDLEKAVKKYDAKKIILAIPSITEYNKRKIIKEANKLKLEILTIPSIEDLISGKITLSQLKPLSLEDVLGRDEVKLDTKGLINLIKENVVLVSGAGGSIGSELCRQILKFKPSVLICLDISEFSLYQIEQEFSNLKIGNIYYFVADVKNEKRINSILKKFSPKIVFHAAAYKHVPLMENLNVSEVLNNNVLGTYSLARASKNAKVSKFILISTDKAVSPTNVMGASKRLAEMICQVMQQNSKTTFITVRFGNVLGSSGSVIPKFQKQIQAGGPVTITHPGIERYFMTIPEASQLVLQASFMGNGGEIFVLDMGKPVKILNLAKTLISILGFDKRKIKIKYTGLRPGEKLYEELFTKNEKILPTSHNKLSIAIVNKNNSTKWMKDMISWISQLDSKEELFIKKELKTWVNEYNSKDFTSS